MTTTSNMPLSDSRYLVGLGDLFGSAWHFRYTITVTESIPFRRPQLLYPLHIPADSLV
jgi:hypothetical protein